MPRDLTALRDQIRTNSSRPEDEDADAHPQAQEREKSSNEAEASTDSESRPENLHPFTGTLTLKDVDACVDVEAAFPEHERASREKFQYRLKVCPELCLGIFTTQPNPTDPSTRQPLLIGHLISTATTSPVVTDASMSLPTTTTTSTSTSTEKQPLGHEPTGRTICVHSLAIRPAYQRRGLGRILLSDFIARMRGSQTADRLALLAHAPLVPYYTSFGFVSQGESEATFGGGGWIDMVLEF